MSIKISIATASVAAGGLAAAGCGSSGPPSWCKDTVSAIVSQGTVGTFRQQLDVAVSEGAPVSSLYSDQMKFLVSPSGLGTGPRDSGPAWRKVVADLEPIASACHISLSELESGLG
jgi:hypothetical protein